MGAMTGEDFAAQLARGGARKQTEKMETIGRLTGAIPQQFNELLTAIVARSSALAQTLPPNRDLDALKETAQRGAELAQRLLGFSRHRVLDLQPLILTELVREALDRLRRQLPANIEVKFEADERSEEHTSELQSPCNLVCRLLLEKKKEIPVQFINDHVQ